MNSKQFKKFLRLNSLPDLPSFTGVGLVGYLGYDAVRYIELRLKNVPAADPITLPDFMVDALKKEDSHCF